MANLSADGFSFDSTPTKSETERFEYAAFDYFEINPGRVAGTFVSYCGIYFSDTGELSGIYVPNNQVQQF